MPGPATTSPGLGALRVLLADDDPHVRSALVELIEAEPTMRLVGVATDAEQAVALAHEHAPDVAVLDVRMPGGGHDAARNIRARSPRTRIVAFSAYGDQRAVVGMVASGATSYLVKGASGREIVDTIRRAAAGDSVLSDEATSQVVDELGHQMQLQERQLREHEFKVGRINEALLPGALRIVYQPIYDLVTGQRCGVEALSRFTLDPQRTPDVWFAEAWEVALGVDLELTAIAASLPVLDQLADHEFLALNVSPQTVLSPRLAEVLGCTQRERLVLEITEHAKVADYDALARVLEEPRRAGLRVASDDTGAGYASLRHILRLDPEIIKLDMSLTRQVDTDQRRRALVAALIAFAEQSRATTVAEGIETEQELAALRAFGATCGQGYLLHRPTPADQLDAAISSVPDSSPRSLK